jgi:hypothetical protein
VSADVRNLGEPGELFDRLVLLDGAQAELVAAMLDVYAQLLPTPRPALTSLAELAHLVDAELVSELSSAIRVQLEGPSSQPGRAMP